MYEGETEATTINDDDSETVAMIKELLETRIRPAVQEDGGDIVFVAFDEATGVVTIKMLGACDGCPSSSITLKSGVENMIKVSVEDSHESARMPRLTVLTRYTLQALRPRGDGDTGGGTGRGGEGGAPGLQRAGAAVVHIECFTRGRGRGLDRHDDRPVRRDVRCKMCDERNRVFHAGPRSRPLTVMAAADAGHLTTFRRNSTSRIHPKSTPFVSSPSLSLSYSLASSNTENRESSS